jgi:hypothetical protein
MELYVSVKVHPNAIAHWCSWDAGMPSITGAKKLKPTSAMMTIVALQFCVYWAACDLIFRQAVDD